MPSLVFHPILTSPKDLRYRTIHHTKKCATRSKQPFQTHINNSAFEWKRGEKHRRRDTAFGFMLRRHCITERHEGKQTQEQRTTAFSFPPPSIIPPPQCNLCSIAKASVGSRIQHFLDTGQP